MMHKFYDEYLPVILLFLGLLFTSATQTRFHNLPVGISEISFLAFLFYGLCRCLSDLESCIRGCASLYKSIMSSFLIQSMLLLFVSFSIGYIINKTFFQLGEGAAHSYIAYAFDFFICLVLVNNVKLLDRAIKLVSLTLPAILMMVYSFYPHAFYLEYRFQGLSTNPNQLALVLVFLPFIQLYVLQAERKLIKIIALVSLLITLFLSYKSHTSALKFSWAMSLICFFIYFLIRYIQLHKVDLTKYLSLFSIGLVCILLQFVILDFSNLNEYFLSGVGEAVVRFKLWTVSSQVLFKSPVFGLGFGSFIDLENMNLHGKSECHNIFFSALVQGGLVGFSLITMLLYFVFLKSWRNVISACLFVSVFTFSMFHSTLRHPIFWSILIWICYCNSPEQKSL